MSKSLALLAPFLFVATVASAFTDAEFSCLRRAASAYRSDYVRDISDGCVPRAQDFYRFLIGRCPSLNGHMTHTQLNGTLNPRSGINWRYHFAMSFTHNGTLYILDPSFSGDEMTVNQWVDVCHPLTATNYSTNTPAALAVARPATAPVNAPTRTYASAPVRVVTAAPVTYYVVQPRPVVLVPTIRVQPRVVYIIR